MKIDTISKGLSPNMSLFKEGFPYACYTEMDYFILNDDEAPVLCPDHDEWLKWMENNKDRCIIGRSYLGSFVIDTVFTGRGNPNHANNLFEINMYIEKEYLENWDSEYKARMSNVPN
jgi:hypothetical protein